MISRLCPLLGFAMLVLVFGAGGLNAQNTAPVPTTFEIISPSDGSASSLINTDFSVNNRIFYGGDFFYLGGDNSGGFLGYPFGGDKDTDRIARGNPSGSRLTLGGTEYGDDADFGSPGGSYVANLPGSRANAADYDPDDTGGGAEYPDYTGMNGFIAINEGDTLEINFSGFIDPNNKMVEGDQLLNGNYTGRNFRSQEGNGTPGNDGANNVTFTALNLPPGATFAGNRLRWVPNFLQGDGATDNSIRSGRVFVDANISNGSTASEFVSAAGDTTSNPAKVGYGVGELRDSLYVIYIVATDDGVPNLSGMDSLFIMVNDSLPNPPPRFTDRTLLRKDSLGLQKTHTFNYLAGHPDTLFSVFEGDSVVITFRAQDQDSLWGEPNSPIAFGLLWNDNLLGVPKGGTTTGNLSGFNQFIRRPGTIDTLAVDTVSTTSGGTAISFRVRVQIPFNLATANEKADSLVVMVSDGNTIVADTFALKVRNRNRAPVWDGDLSSLPSDSALVFSPDPASAQPGTVQPVGPFTLNNGQTDSTNFSLYVYDPDFLIGDSLGVPLSFSASGSHQGTLNPNTGLNVFLPTESDTVTYTFTITARDANPSDYKSTARQVRFRVAPAPKITRVEPAKGAVNDVFTIYGSGFGLFDRNVEDTSKVVFYATDGNGNRQNIEARITSWSKEKIVAVVPWGVPTSGLDQSLSYIVPDTIRVISAIYGGFDTYPFVVLNDSTGFDNLEVVNVTSTSATIRYRTRSTGQDSIVVAAVSDTLDIHSAAFIDPAKFKKLPTFVQSNAGLLTEIRSSVQVFRDQTNPTDWTQVITLTDLSPSTTYKFFIATAAGTFAADSLRNINGPYRPKKIDRNTPANNSLLAAFRLRTLPVTSSTGGMYTVMGKTYYSGGAATNATVRLKLVSATSPADTSMPVIVTVGSDSTWMLNLANVRALDGSGFIHSEGDYMLFEMDGSEKGFEQYDTLRAADAVMPMVIRTVKLVPRVNYEIELKTGLNLIAMPHRLFKGEPSKARDILSRVGGGSPSITRYVASSGMQETITRTTGGMFIGADDFEMKVGEGYFLKVNSGNTLTFSGRVYTSDVPTIQFQNAGLYFVSRPAQDLVRFRSWDAVGIASTVANVSEVIRFNPTLQGYETYLAGSGGTNFGIDVGQGYIFRLTAASSWNPNNNGTLLAGAADKPAAGATLPMVIDAPGDRSFNGDPEVTISNITSSAAVVTWRSGPDQSGALRLTGADGSETMVQPKALAGGLNHALITGLKAGVEYGYRVEGLGAVAAGAVTGGSFAAAQVGTGLNPYSLYGRLVDSGGRPVTGILVLARLAGAENGIETGYQSAVSDENGYWILNLANFKESATGLAYEWAVGDRLNLALLGSGIRESYSSEVVSGSPRNFALDIRKDGETNTDAVSGPAPAVLPRAYSLAQNVPNPFNPSTTIRYAVPDSEGQVSVSLDIFNLRGQHVKSLVSAVRGPGEYQVEWDGTDSAGRAVASGVYFYRLSTPDYKATRKMIILK